MRHLPGGQKVRSLSLVSGARSERYKKAVLGRYLDAGPNVLGAGCSKLIAKK
jgi:hypothetical protein